MLRCQGSGAPGPTKWYIGQRLQQQITSNYIYVSKNYLGSGSYRCCSPGAELSPPITLRFSDGERHDGYPRVPRGLRVGSVSQPLTPCVTGAHPHGRWLHPRAHQCIPVQWEPTGCIPVRRPPRPSLAEWLVLQVPARVLLEGDTVPLRCRAWDDIKITRVQFFREQEALGGPSRGTELLLSPLQLQHGGRYRCRAIVNKLFVQGQESALVPVVVQELFSVPVLHLKGPAKPPEGAPLALGCLSQPSPLRPLAHLQHVFYRDEVVVGGPQDSPQLQLPAVGLSDSGNYSCEVRTETASVRKHSALVTVTVRRVPVSGVFLVAQPPKGQVVEGDRLVLRCMVGAGTGPLSFSWHRHGLALPLATGPRYELHAVQPQDGGRYHCTATNGGTAADSLPLWVTVLGEQDPPALGAPPPQHHRTPRCGMAMATGLTPAPSLRVAVPVANATITMARTEPSVPSGESLNLTCSVEAGTAPVTFTWLRDGQQLGSGPVLSLGAVGPTHAGTYQCLATNHLGTHRIFQVRSPVLTLSVTQPRQERWQQGTATSRSRPAPPQEPTVVYAVLPAPHARLRLPSDTYENVP
ncbi:Fc receptor-like protein 2 [Grus japonensis]|uniref:Fc receptor-like protein 2 n=1 Tax=Grus japonensis TaxID=30415 RepID=A0ABC9XTV7_GRUJA